MTAEPWPRITPHLPTRPAPTPGPVRTSLHLREDAPVVLHMDPPSFASEQYRTLALQIEERVVVDADHGYVLAVTSAEEGSGKTLTALNLALTLTRGGERRVALVECDLWRPRLHTYFEPAPAQEHGLLDVLEERLTTYDAARRIEGTSLELIPAGCEGKPGDLLSGKRLLSLLHELRRRYELVVVDTPPLPLLASSRAVAGRADGVVVVVRAGRTRRKDVEAVLAALGPEKVTGVVLNGTRPRHRGYY